ncbi:MFS general substrate transporter [Cylindrobasidium torrendii FP15055 ss-10]|uniref:MFS general substrate transporter n=1 Tax=Cylindrobasidium torrendii FP15055 ss-10 TaxID=1314674 RepID=A0A0D7B312_9AGAR|nr:MFS general substrate transporter [Cylindrobasidium torrendii FP15055 ss-10]
MQNEVPKSRNLDELREEQERIEHERAAGRSTLRSILIAASITMGMVVNMALTTAGSIPLPTISHEFEEPTSNLVWVVSAYALSSGCLLLMFGRLADLYGRKRMFVCGMTWLSAFSLGTGFANDAITLQILRGLSGVGAAAQVPASLGILAHSFPPSRARSFAFATFAAGAPLGGGTGLILSGVLTQLTAQTWRSIFWLLAGLGGLCVAIAVVVIDGDLPSLEEDQRVDWFGAFLISAGLVFVVFVLTQGEVAEPDQWKTPYIIALLIVGVFLIVAFVFWQRYLEKVNDDVDRPRSKWTPPPLMRVSLWTRANGRLAGVMVVAFLNWCSFQCWCYWSQLYFQDYEHRTPILTVVRIIPMFVTGIFLNVIVGTTIGRLPFVFFMVIGTAGTSLASLLYAFIDDRIIYWALGFPGAIVSVTGADFVFAAGTLFCAKVALPHEQSLAGALFQTMVQLGTSFGITVSTIVFDRLNHPGGPKLPAYHAAMWTGFGFGMLGALVSVLLFWNVGVVGDQGPKKDVEGTTESIVEEVTDRDDITVRASKEEKKVKS